jgi:hypothetical protein
VVGAIAGAAAISTTTTSILRTSTVTTVSVSPIAITTATIRSTRSTSSAVSTASTASTTFTFTRLTLTLAVIILIPSVPWLLALPAEELLLLSVESIILRMLLTTGLPQLQLLMMHTNRLLELFPVRFLLKLVHENDRLVLLPKDNVTALQQIPIRNFSTFLVESLRCVP